MALEIRDKGKVALIADFGSGPNIIFSNKLISDGQWHRILVERLDMASFLLESMLSFVNTVI